MNSVIFLFLAAVLQYSYALECACAKGNLTVTDSQNVAVSTLLVDECVPFLGLVRNLNHEPVATVYLNGSVLWVRLSGLAIIPYQDNCRQLTPVASSDSALIVPRAEWGALAPSSPILSLPALPQYVYIHHGATRGCSTEEECKEMARLYQKMHMHDRGWWDVGYSFMIGEDGNVYEGRGWDKVGAHTLGHNDIGVGICFIGNFDTRIPNDKALNALKRLINLGVSTGRLPHDYKLQRHCDVVRSTECPGRVFRGQVATWEHFHPTDSSFCPNV